MNPYVTYTRQRNTHTHITREDADLCGLCAVEGRVSIDDFCGTNDEKRCRDKDIQFNTQIRVCLTIYAINHTQSGSNLNAVLVLNLRRLEFKFSWVNRGTLYVFLIFFYIFVGSLKCTEDKYLQCILFPQSMNNKHKLVLLLIQYNYLTFSSLIFQISYVWKKLERINKREKKKETILIKKDSMFGNKNFELSRIYSHKLIVCWF